LESLGTAVRKCCLCGGILKINQQISMMPSRMRIAISWLILLNKVNISDKNSTRSDE
jgi:hypothetical protein